jgi:hypothetical protein
MAGIEIAYFGNSGSSAGVTISALRHADSHRFRLPLVARMAIRAANTLHLFSKRVVCSQVHRNPLMTLGAGRIGDGLKGPLMTRRTFFSEPVMAGGQRSGAQQLGQGHGKTRLPLINGGESPEQNRQQNKHEKNQSGESRAEPSLADTQGI